MTISNLKPEIVWKFFHQITQVPRPSKKEGKIIRYLESFAAEYNVPIKKDHAGNILMTKPALMNTTLQGSPYGFSKSTTPMKP